ncbi:uncharacterized protein LOC6572098 [Drosophila mojavensis]|uniref:Protein anoxia up-regulated n=1 Tax=Drosophila mojavensis TaxID=7230 RepID=B4KCA2_DROMO|nr:uncharacterized protein LOC6572098 [Drosophila mojavensis]EDW13711.1 uncharacterized protein Dmoj_GI23735 [Drosophila mojavensis]
MDTKYQAHLKLTCILLVLSLAEAIPKLDNKPKPYSDNTQWSRAYPNENRTQLKEPETASTKDRLERLGYTTGYGSLNGYPSSSGLSAYNPIKLDLGGVVLGTLVGIGAIILIPKILSAFHGGYGGYGRSEDDNDLASLSSMINKIDNVLGQNNIDSTSCMQRAVCGYIRSTENNIKSGVSDQMDEFIHMLSGNSLVDYLLDGTAIKEALDHGKETNDRSCEELYVSCPLNSKSATNILMKLLPKKQKPTKLKSAGNEDES